MSQSRQVQVDELDRITEDPRRGKATIRGMRVTVATVVALINGGYGINEVLSMYPTLEREDIAQALRFAAAPKSGRVSRHSSG